jgi:hypothetical protein
MFRITHLIIAIILLLAGCHSPESASPTAATDVRTLEWDELMPADFEPEAIFKDVDIASLADDSPRAQELMTQLRKLWDEAPIVEALDGLRVRLPGFAVPLEMNGEAVSQFLLVPFYGACIHVPPPPANQTVLVEATTGITVQIRQAFDTVWVTGRLAVHRTDTGLAKAGYTLTATEVSPYDEKQR